MTALRPFCMRGVGGRGEGEGEGEMYTTQQVSVLYLGTRVVHLEPMHCAVTLGTRCHRSRCSSNLKRAYFGTRFTVSKEHLHTYSTLPPPPWLHTTHSQQWPTTPTPRHPPSPSAAQRPPPRASSQVR